MQGIASESLSRRQRFASASVQMSRRPLIQIMNAVALDSSLLACVWHRFEPIVDFRERMPDKMVKESESEALKSHIYRPI